MMYKFVETLSLYSKKNATIASGATPIESADRAPDDIATPTLMQE
jgi:hypothetical protein